MAKYFNALILTLSIAHANSYLFSYQAQMRDAMIINESIFFSPAMQTPKKSKPITPITFYNPDDLSINQLIKNNQYTFLDHLEKNGIVIKNFGLSQNNQDRSLTILTIPTTYLKVDFNRDFVTIAPLK
jgi:hypothetical protein